MADLAGRQGITLVSSISGLNDYGITDTLNNKINEAAKSEKAINKALETGEDKELMNAAREFESYFLQMMLKEMRNTIPKDGLIPKNNAEEIFQSMLDEEYAKDASQGDGMGLAQMIYTQMTKTATYTMPPQIQDQNLESNAVADPLEDTGEINKV